MTGEVEPRPGDAVPEREAGARPSSSPSPRSTSPAQVRRQVRGMGYEDGAKALRPPARRGSATLVAAAGEREWAFDNSYTPAMMEQMAQDPGRGVRGAARAVARQALKVPGGVEQDEHHPEVVDVGEVEDGPAGGFPAGRRRAVVVANQNYPGAPLEAPGREAEAFRNVLAGRGFDVQTDGDVSAGRMRTDYDGLLAGASPGDELVGYFSGHGAPEGLVGILHGPQRPDILPTGEVSALAEQAVTRGADLTFVMDSCHSGAAVRKTLADTAARAKAAGGKEGANSILAAIRLARQDLDGCSREWDRKVGPAFETIRMLLAKDRGPMNAHDRANHETQITWWRQERVILEQEFRRKLQRRWMRRLARLKRTVSLIEARTGSRLSPAPLELTDLRTFGAQTRWLDELEAAALRADSSHPSPSK